MKARRAADGSWIFEVSPLQGHIEDEIDVLIATVKAYLLA